MLLCDRNQGPRSALSLHARRIAQRIPPAPQPPERRVRVPRHSARTPQGRFRRAGLRRYLSASASGRTYAGADAAALACSVIHNILKRGERSPGNSLPYLFPDAAHPSAHPFGAARREHAHSKVCFPDSSDKHRPVKRNVHEVRSVLRDSSSPNGFPFVQHLHKRVRRLHSSSGSCRQPCSEARSYSRSF